MEDFLTRNEHREFAQRVEDEEKRQNRRLQKLEDETEKITSLAMSIDRIATSTETMARELNAQGKRLKELEEIPGENWSSLKSGILNAIAAAIGGGIVAVMTNFIH